jgi:hypothetical protein
LSQQRQLVLGLLAAFGDGAALLGLGGELLAGQLDGSAGALAEWLRTEGRQRIMAEDRAKNGGAWERVTLGTGDQIEVALLQAPGERPVGFLARRARPVPPQAIS